MTQSSAAGLAGVAVSSRSSGSALDPQDLHACMQGVLYSHRANFLQSFTMSMPDACCLTSATTVLAIVPMFHANSWALAFGAPMFGSKLVLPGHIISLKPTVAQAPPKERKIAAYAASSWPMLVHAW